MRLKKETRDKNHIFELVEVVNRMLYLYVLEIFEKIKSCEIL